MRTNYKYRYNSGRFWGILKSCVTPDLDVSAVQTVLLDCNKWCILFVKYDERDSEGTHVLYIVSCRLNADDRLNAYVPVLYYFCLLYTSDAADE